MVEECEEEKDDFFNFGERPDNFLSATLLVPQSEVGNKLMRFLQQPPIKLSILHDPVSSSIVTSSPSQNTLTPTPW